MYNPYEKMSRNHLQTMRLTCQEIYQGVREWTALGNFLNYWFSYAKDRRSKLIVEPLPPIPSGNEYALHWAAYCAASVEHLCAKYHEPCPNWVHDPQYILPSPWFSLLINEQNMRQYTIDTTPPEFLKRNIYSGNEMFQNKWELLLT